MFLWVVLAALGVLLLVKLFEISPFNDFGNDIIVVKSNTELRHTVARVARDRHLKPRWCVEDSKTKQVFLTSWRRRVHVVYSTDPDINSFMDGVTRTKGYVVFLGQPLSYVKKLEPVGGGRLEYIAYSSDKIKPGSMYMVRFLSRRGTITGTCVVRKWGPRMGGGLRRYKGPE